VLHTNFSNPSVSLLKSICYPQLAKLYSKACEFGQQHENDAIRVYHNVMENEHNSFEFKKSGLILDVENPFIGASPDRIILFFYLIEFLIQLQLW